MEYQAMKPMYSIKGQESEICYPLEYWQEMLDNGDLYDGNAKQLELEVWKANIPTDGTFWCKEDGEAYDCTESWCGSQCSSYAPRNGKSGCCRWWGPTFSPTGKTVIIRKSKVYSKGRTINKEAAQTTLS